MTRSNSLPGTFAGMLTVRTVCHIFETTLRSIYQVLAYIQKYAEKTSFMMYSIGAFPLVRIGSGQYRSIWFGPKAALFHYN